MINKIALLTQPSVSRTELIAPRFPTDESVGYDWVPARGIPRGVGDTRSPTFAD